MKNRNKKEDKQNEKLGVIISCNISREIRKKKGVIGEQKMDILKKVSEDVMLLVTQNESKFVSLRAAEIFSNVIVILS